MNEAALPVVNDGIQQDARAGMAVSYAKLP